MSEVGTWWGAGDVEVDVVALDRDQRVTVAGSCKWTRSPVDVRDYAELRSTLERSALGSSDTACALYSRSGFTERLRALASGLDEPRLLLVGLEDLYAV